MVNPDGAAAVTRIKQGLRSWMAERRLRGNMADLSEQQLDRALHDLGLTRRDLFTVSKRNPGHRNRMAKLLEHFEWTRNEPCRDTGARSRMPKEFAPVAAT